MTGWDVSKPERPTTVGMPTPEKLRAIAGWVDRFSAAFADVIARMDDLSDEDRQAWTDLLQFDAHDELYVWADDLERDDAKWVTKDG